MTDYALAERVRRAEQQLSLATSHRQVNRMQAIVKVTETALAQASDVHRYAISAARNTLVEAERIQRSAGRSLDDTQFRSATDAYLNELTYITEAAGIDMLRVIDTALR